MSEKASQIATVYSAPLSTSAVANVKEDKHGEYVTHMADRLEKLFEDGFLSGTGVFNKRLMSIEHGKLPNKVIPDLRYESDYLVVRGEAKVNLPDLVSPHTTHQLVSYVMDMKEEYLDHRKVLMISTPFCLQGIVYQTLNTIKRVNGDDFFDDVEIELVCELTDKVLEPPKQWEKMVEIFSKPKTNLVNLPEYGYTTVEEVMLPIDSFEFDGKNARLLGYDPNEVLSQEECYRRLLADGDNRDREKSVKRRIQFASGCINEPIIVKKQANGKYRSYEGNSRVMISRNILEQTASADGYRMLRAIVFPEDTSDGVLEAYKQYLQSQIRLEHGKIRDAADMYRKAEQGMTYDEISETFGGSQSVELIENAVESIRWMKRLAMSDDTMDKLYTIAYHLRSSVTNNIIRYWEKKGIKQDDVLLTFATPGIDEEWLKYNNYRKFVTVMNSMHYTKWSEPAIKGFINQTGGWATFKDWSDNYAKLEAKNKCETGTKTVINKVTNSTETLIGFNEFLSGVKKSLAKSDSKALDKKILKNYTQSQRADFARGIRELFQTLLATQDLVLEIDKMIDEHSDLFE